MAEDYWHAGWRFLVSLLLCLLFSLCTCAQRTLSSGKKYLPVPYIFLDLKTCIKFI